MGNCLGKCELDHLICCNESDEIKTYDSEHRNYFVMPQLDKHEDCKHAS